MHLLGRAGAGAGIAGGARGQSCPRARGGARARRSKAGTTRSGPESIWLHQCGEAELFFCFGFEPQSQDVNLRKVSEAAHEREAARAHAAQKVALQDHVLSLLSFSSTFFAAKLTDLYRNPGMST